jgi:hypothetical protein
MTIKSCRNCGQTHQRPQPYCEDCEFMTQPEAIKRLKLSRSGYLNIVKAGKLHPRRIGVGRGKLLVLRAEVDAMLA